MNYSLFRSGENDRPLAAQSDADGGGSGGGLQAGPGVRRGQRLHPAVLPQALCRDAPRQHREGQHDDRLSARRAYDGDSRSPKPSRPSPTAGRSWTWSSTSARCSAARGTTCGRTLRRSLQVAHDAGAKVKVIFENCYLQGRAQDPPLPDLRRAEGRLGQDQHRLRHRRGDARRPRPDAEARPAARAGQSGRRRPRPGHAHQGPRAGRQPLRRQPHQGNARRMPPAAGPAARSTPRPARRKATSEICRGHSCRHDHLGHRGREACSARDNFSARSASSSSRSATSGIAVTSRCTSSRCFRWARWASTSSAARAGASLRWTC